MYRRFADSERRSADDVRQHRVCAKQSVFYPSLRKHGEGPAFFVYIHAYRV